MPEPKRLLLFTGDFREPQRNAVAATLAWLTAERGYLFEVYYHCARSGIHYGGGDPLQMPSPDLMGGLFTGGRHAEAMGQMLRSFDTTVVSLGQAPFRPLIEHLGGTWLVAATDLPSLYEAVFAFFEIPFPSQFVLLGSGAEAQLPGLDAYCYPEILYRKALGAAEDTPLEQMAPFLSRCRQVLAFYPSAASTTYWQHHSLNVTVLDEISKKDDYGTVCERIAARWAEKGRGWILGDPDLISSWVPLASEEARLSVYSKPQTRIVDRLAARIKDGRQPMIGRQYDDHDFFALSRLDTCLQIVDPGRPPLPVVRHAPFPSTKPPTLPPDAEPDYAQLEVYAREGRILSSPLFWTGMIREVENLYYILDLVALTSLRAGIVVSSQTFAYLPPAVFSALMAPLSAGGVFPHLEPVLGSCGIGVGIESLMSPETLHSALSAAVKELRQRLGDSPLQPKGWWSTMDARTVRSSWLKRPTPIRFTGRRPFLQVRHHGISGGSASSPSAGTGEAEEAPMKKRLAKIVRNGPLASLFLRYRPYEGYEAGEIAPGIPRAVYQAGLEYFFSKSHFGSPSRVVYDEEDFVGMNYTAGQWDGWTPFETINGLDDLRKAERRLLRHGKPGWLVGTLDSCLWTFSGPIWQRSGELMAIGKFFAKGGESGQLVNVRPNVIARYARLLRGRGMV